MNPLLRLLRLIAPFKRWIALAVLLSFMTIGSSVGLMAMSAYLIAKSALITDVSEIAIPVTLVRVFAILRAGFRYLERYFSHTATFRILTHLRVWLYRSIEPLAPARLLSYRSGDILARIIGDIETLENFYIRVVVPPVVAVLVTVFACAILGAFDTSLAVALLIFLTLTGVVLPILSHRLSSRYAAALISNRADLNAMLLDEIQGIADLLAFDRAGQHQERVLALGRELNRIQERMAMLRGVSNALAALLTGLAGLTVVGLAIPLVSGGKIEGVFLALLPLAAIASFEAVQPLSAALQQLEANRSAAQRLFELIDAPPPVTDPTSSPQPQDHSIAIRDLRFRYTPDEPPVLDGVSLYVPSGSRVAIVGPSGAGKSSLVNVLLRFWDYQEGRVCIGGHDVRVYCADDVRALIAVVPQHVYLFNATIRDNLFLANPEATEEQIIAACTMAQIHDFIQGLPDGYDTLIGENGLLLSGGERQRLAIARAILKNAPILILDEATANLDALTAQKLIRALEPFMQGRTTLIITHRLRHWQHVDTVITLDSGRVVAQT